MKLRYTDHTGKKLPELTVSADLFAAKVSPALMAQAIRVYLDRQHQHTSKVKTRGEVKLTTAKWFRQKGTGRARHGAQSAPIFVGGGVAHGPTGLAPRIKTLPLKMRRLSLIGALTNKAQAGQVTIIKDLTLFKGKTADLSKLVKKLELKDKILVLTAANHPAFLKAGANIKALSSQNYQLTNTLEILNSNHLLLEQATLPLLETWLTPKAKLAAPVTKATTKAPVEKATSAKKTAPAAKTTKKTTKAPSAKKTIKKSTKTK